MITAIFLIPFVEHFTERTKFMLIDWVLPESVEAYYAHYLAPLIAFAWAVVLLWGLEQFSLERAILSAGGAMVYYEISSFWKDTKRKLVPISTRGVDKNIVIDV